MFEDVVADDLHGLKAQERGGDVPAANALLIW
jgi:hypothetical protein